MPVASYLNKLRAMSAAELLHRVRYQARVSAERRLHGQGRLAPSDRLRTALVPELSDSSDWEERLIDRRRRAAPVSPALDDAEAIRALFADRFELERAGARRVAQQARRHRLRFFGQTFSFGPSIPWNADPQTGSEWPQRYHRDVQVAGGNHGFGDVKYVWELNRHQFLVDLAKSAWLERSRDDADEVVALVAHWSETVPYATGAPWACALEPAFRVWSWIWAYDLLRQAGLLSDAAHCRWLSGVYDHGRFLAEHLEFYTSPYNHLIGEASALYALGVLFPEFRAAPRWRERGRAVLEQTVEQQFHADGGSVEQSTFYHHATLGFYMLAALLGRRHDEELSCEIWAAIERGLEFSLALTLPDGRLPEIGGADDGKPIRFEERPLWDFRPYLAIGAVIFSRPDFKCVAERFWEDALWLLGTAGLDAFDRLPATPPATTAVLPSSGYTVARSEWSSSADYLCFDCGPQAAGLRRDSVPSAAHGHADCLSVVVALGGHRVLVDPGFYCYNGDPDWEVRFRRTEVHNTATVDGRDQARHVSKMAWSHTFQACLDAWDSSAALAWSRGSHDGYARGPHGVVHRRTAWLRDGGYVLLYDEFVGKGDHDVVVNFQCAEGDLDLESGADRAVLNGRFELAWACPMPVRATTLCGGTGPADGWIAVSLGVRRPAPCLKLGFRLRDGCAALLSVVSDRARGGGRARVDVEKATPGHLLSARVRGVGWEDSITAWTNGLGTDAPVRIVRERADASGRSEHVTRPLVDDSSGPAGDRAGTLASSRGRPG